VSLEDAQPDEMDIQVTRAVALLNLTGSLEPLKKVFERMPPTVSNEYFEYSAYVPWMERDPDAVIAVLNSPIWVNEGSGPEWGVLRLRQLGDAWRLKGDEGRARAHYEEAASHLDSVLNGPVESLVLDGTHIAMSLASLGRFDEAVALANQIVDKFPLEKDAMQPAWLLNVRALVRGRAGDMDGALEDLELSLNTPGPDPVTRWNLHYDPSWDFMRDDPRFVELATPDNLVQ
ncbi:MAG: tetratricopeptide repeat protein, partial [Xanthomonadales bacterium]|nr:tetratricopeptide repeat protein [Xanthomonadales bacterium]